MSLQIRQQALFALCVGIIHVYFTGEGGTYCHDYGMVASPGMCTVRALSATSPEAAAIDAGAQYNEPTQYLRRAAAAGGGYRCMGCLLCPAGSYNPSFTHGSGPVMHNPFSCYDCPSGTVPNAARDACVSSGPGGALGGSLGGPSGTTGGAVSGGGGSTGGGGNSISSKR